MNHILIVDIETIKGQNHDVALAPFIENLIGKKKRITKAEQAKMSIDELAEAQSDKAEEAIDKAALTPVAGRLACIGVFEIMNLPTIDGKFHFLCHSSEAWMIEALKSLIKPQTILVTFNGRSFDFPFLMFRAAINKIPLALDIYPYNGKGFGLNQHIDLKVHLETISCLSNINKEWSVTKASLSKYAQYFNLPRKKSISDGEISIEKCIETGDMQTLEEYSKVDVVDLTYGLWKIFEGNFT